MRRFFLHPTLRRPPRPDLSQRQYARVAHTTNEVLLTQLPGVNVSTFGRLFTYPVDGAGYIYARRCTWPICLSRDKARAQRGV